MSSIIGFDPASTKNLGWSIIEYVKENEEANLKRYLSGTFTLQTFDDSWRSLGPLSELIEEFLKKEDPDLVIIEKTSAFRGTKTGGFVTGQVSYCIGVILSVCSRMNLDVDFVYPTHVKKVLTGDGRATKSQIIKSVKSIMKQLGVAEPIKFDSDHAADATGNVLAWMIDNHIFVI